MKAQTLVPLAAAAAAQLLVVGNIAAVRFPAEAAG